MKAVRRNHEEAAAALIRIPGVKLKEAMDNALSEEMVRLIQSATNNEKEAPVFNHADNVQSIQEDRVLVPPPPLSRATKALDVLLLLLPRC